MNDEQTLDVIEGQNFVPARPGDVRLVHLLYLLHSIGLVIGAASQAVTMIGAFVFGWASIIAIIINYVKRDELKGSFLASHLVWQSDTFWRCLIVMLIGVMLYFVFIGFFINWLIFGFVGLWAVYRIIKGWLALNDGKAMPLA
jgi:uncharacterized membrane protein